MEIYDVATQQVVATFPVANDKTGIGPPYYGVSFSPNAKELVIGTRSRLHVYDIRTGKRVRIVCPDAKSPHNVASFAVSDKLLAIGNFAGKVCLGTYSDGQIVDTIQNRERGWVTKMRFSPDGKWLAYYVSGVLHVADVSAHKQAATE